MRDRKQFDKLIIKRVYPYQIIDIFTISKILNTCGKDMSVKYKLNHWNNSLIKSFIIVCIGVLKNKVYLVKEIEKPLATFQIRIQNSALFFEKLAVLPSLEGKGYGAFCMEAMEKHAIDHGLQKIRMEVYSKSKNAIEFYLYLGYKKVAERQTLKYTDIIMEKVL